MSKTIICCTSNQTLPNFLIIKELFEQGDTLYFITTDAFPKIDFLQQALALNNLVQKGNIKILHLKNKLEESFNGMMSEFEKSFSDDREYIVNLTGGTKFESLALFSFFQKKENARLVYVPFPNNYYIEFKDNRQVNFNKKADIKEFFACYGIEFEEDAQQFCMSDNGLYAESFFGEYLKLSRSELSLLSDLRKTVQSKRKPDYLPYENIEKSRLKDFLQKINFPVDFSSMGKEKREMYIKFLCGIWFEEYIKVEIAKAFAETKISSGTIKAEGNQKDNELDCVFLRNNKLVIIECKTFLQSGWIQNAVDKSSGIGEKLKALSRKRYFFYINKEENPNIDSTINDAKNQGIIFYHISGIQQFKEAISDILEYTK